ncbi:STAS domain-containing protein [Vibrio hippocampi]|uniref:Anti-sigma factor antagonist n=1 Tax=Vibrio hippocampi TaxID=654686 RepID=A0ABM8ZIM2_9VIBR|nr:STAS domain-containing protein [Vibrio hippocampi]CAH0525746.1 hypothetical protein VHP8226_01276 [Vibrio hippocampi]
MKYEVFNNQNFTIVHIQEPRFDAKLASGFRQAIEDIQADIRPNLLLELSSVTFMDSSGLGAIMAMYKLLRDKQIVLVGATPAVRDLLKLTRMDRLVKTYDSLEQAMVPQA